MYVCVDTHRLDLTQEVYGLDIQIYNLRTFRTIGTSLKFIYKSDEKYLKSFCNSFCLGFWQYL
jgi:hypothetical protein